MIKIEMLLFGITADLLGTSSLQVKVPVGATIYNLKTQLIVNHPQLEKIDSYAIAVNEEYASDDMILKENDVIAIIPPVSGG